jgi:hypothetical protein
MERSSHPRYTKITHTKITYELIHTDLVCSKEDGLQTEGISYVLTAMDDFSRCAEVFIVSSKGQAAPVYQSLAKHMERQTATKVKMIKFNRRSEYAGLKVWMHAEGIVAQAVPAYTPEANVRAERLNRIEKERALLRHFNLPLNLWQFAVQVAAHTQNLILA